MKHITTLTHNNKKKMKLRRLVLVMLVAVNALTAMSQSTSGTLPVMYINTEGGAPITSKEDYLTADCWIDAMGLDGYESLGSASSPLTLQIRGRGNYTWTGFEKKPYRLKFAEKVSPVSMVKSKHFVLLAHADDNLGFLRNTVGFQLSRLLGLAYTPTQEPVEVVLNGNYIGLYMLTENLRVDKNRVNITEQADEETDVEAVTGGWLVEIDNYDEEGQVRITEGNGELLRFTYHSPEVLSSVQSNYLTNIMEDTNSAIYASDKNSTQWEYLIDMDALVRFYIVQEVMDNAESFHGSCYLHKDRGHGTKWIFGPVWDFGNSFHRGTNKFIYQDPPFGQSWIGEIAKFPRFQEHVKEVWRPFYGEEYLTLSQYIDAFAAKISQAAVKDGQRWPQYSNSNMQKRVNDFKSKIKAKTDFLRQKWGEGTTGVSEVKTAGNATDAVYDLRGVRVGTCYSDGSMSTALPKGIYIIGGNKKVVR